MKIVCIDNFGRDEVSDRLVAENIKSKGEGELMVNGLNAKTHNESPHYYKLYEDDYKLYKFEY